MAAAKLGREAPSLGSAAVRSKAAKERKPRSSSGPEARDQGCGTASTSRLRRKGAAETRIILFFGAQTVIVCVAPGH